MRISDWSSDVCSSDLVFGRGDGHQLGPVEEVGAHRFEDAALVHQLGAVREIAAEAATAAGRGLEARGRVAGDSPLHVARILVEKLGDGLVGDRGDVVKRRIGAERGMMLVDREGGVKGKRGAGGWVTGGW